MYSRRAGFTVIELIVAMAISALIVVSIIVLLINLTSSSSATVKMADQIRNNESVFSTLERDLRLTHSFRATTSLADSNSAASPLQPDGWVFRGTGANNRILILQTYATTRASQDNTHQIVYRQDIYNSCPVGRDPVFNNVIYFVRDNTLYRRSLVEATAPGAYCGGSTSPSTTISEKQSCTNPGGSGMPTNCTLRDVALATGITSFHITYYALPGDTSELDIYPQSNPDANATLTGASAVRVQLSTQGVAQENLPDFTSYRRISKGATHEF